MKEKIEARQEEWCSTQKTFRARILPRKEGNGLSNKNFVKLNFFLSLENMAKCSMFGCFSKTPNSNPNSPAYNRKYQSEDESTTRCLFEKGIKSNSAENFTEYCRSRQCDNHQSQILQPRHKYYRNSNHHRIVQRRKSIWKLTPIFIGKFLNWYLSKYLCGSSPNAHDRTRKKSC